MGGRYKNVNGQAVWEELPDGVNAPNQIAPPPGGQTGGSSMPPPPEAAGSAGFRPGGLTPGQRPGPIIPPADLAGGTAPAPSAPAPTAIQSMPAPDTSANKGPRLNPGDPGYGMPSAPAAGAPAAPGSNAGTQRPTVAAPPGFDQDKWNDPNLGVSNKYIVGRILAAGGSIEDAARAVGARVISEDKIQYPDGFIADVFFDVEGQRRVQYTDVTGGGSGSAQASSASGAGAGAGGHMGASGLPGATGGSDFNSTVRNALLQQLGMAGQPVTENDPIIARQFEAQSNVLERNRRDRRAADAERAAMNGLLSGGQSSGSFEQNIASGFEDKANAQTQILGGLMDRERSARRQQMVQMLQMAIQTGDNDLERSLRQQLAQMDLAFQRDRWNDDFGLRASEAIYQRDRDLAQYGGFY